MALQSLDDQVLLSYRYLMKKNLNRTPRLYIEVDIAGETSIDLSPDQAHYIGKVMRLTVGNFVRCFNGRDGEWQCQIEQIGKRKCRALAINQLRQQNQSGDIDYLFAPLKSARLDYMVQKATEMGAARLRPVITQFTQNHRYKHERMVANCLEAAEQCNLLDVPEILETQTFDQLLGQWDQNRQLVFCDEATDLASPIKKLSTLAPKPLALLVGPEGGFSDNERQRLLELPFVTPISLGPRILRADTAAVAGLTLLQATLGDW